MLPTACNVSWSLDWLAKSALFSAVPHTSTSAGADHASLVLSLRRHVQFGIWLRNAAVVTIIFCSSADYPSDHFMGINRVAAAGFICGHIRAC